MDEFSEIDKLKNDKEKYKNAATIYKLKAKKVIKQNEELRQNIEKLQKQVQNLQNDLKNMQNDDHHITQNLASPQKSNNFLDADVHDQFLSADQQDQLKRQKQISMWQGHLKNDVFEKKSKNLFCDNTNDYVMNQFLTVSLSKGFTPEMIFRALDKEYKSFIQVQELRGFLLQMGLSQNHVQRIIYLMDEENSGQIHKQDYINCLQAYEISQEQNRNQKSFQLSSLMKFIKYLNDNDILIAESFQKMNKTRDNRISRQNLIDYINTLQAAMSNKEIISMYNMIDDNKQGLISKERYLHIMNTAFQTLVFADKKDQVKQKMINPDKIHLYRFLNQQEYQKESDRRNQLFQERFSNNIFAYMTDDPEFNKFFEEINEMRQFKHLIFEKLDKETQINKLTLLNISQDLILTDKIIQKDRILQIFEDFQFGKIQKEQLQERKVFLHQEEEDDENQNNQDGDNNNQEQNNNNEEDNQQISQQQHSSSQLKDHNQSNQKSSLQDINSAQLIQNNNKSQQKSQQQQQSIQELEKEYIRDLKFNKSITHISNSKIHPLLQQNQSLALDQHLILQEMNKFNPDEKNIHDNPLLSYLIYYSNLFAKIARALNYDYDFIKIEDFFLDLKNYTYFQKSLEKLTEYVFYIIYHRFNFSDEFFAQNNIKKEFLHRIFQIKWFAKIYLKSNGLKVLPDKTTTGDKWMESQQYNQEPYKFEQDLNYIEDIIQILIINPYQYTHLQLIDEAQRRGLWKIKGFFGTTGYGYTLIDKIRDPYKDHQYIKQINNDIRGIMCSGRHDTLYVVFHNNVSEYDNFADKETNLVHSENWFLKLFPKQWKFHNGYGTILSHTLEVPQYKKIVLTHHEQQLKEKKQRQLEKQQQEQENQLQEQHNDQEEDNQSQYQQDHNNSEKEQQEQEQSIEQKQLELEYSPEKYKELTLIQIIFEHLETSDTVLFTGFEQGAALSQLASVYTKLELNNLVSLYNKTHLNQLQVKLQAFDIPPCFNRTACQEIEEIFSQQLQLYQKQSLVKLMPPLLRINRMFHHTIHFESEKQILQKIRQFQSICVTQFEEKFYHYLRQLFESDDYESRLFDMLGNKQRHLVAELGLENYDDFIRINFTNPMKKSLHKANFLHHIIEMTEDPKRLYFKLNIMWELAAISYSSEFYNMIPSTFIRKFNFHNFVLDGTVLKKMISILARLLCSREDNLEQVILESETIFIDLLNPNKDQQIEANKKYFLPRQLDIQYLHQIMPSFIKGLIKEHFYQGLISQSPYMQQLSYIGEILDGILYFSSDYSNLGHLLLNDQDFVQNYQYPELKNQIHLSNQIKIYDPRIILDSHVIKSYGSGIYYQDLHPEDQIDYLQTKDAIFNQHTTVNKRISNYEVFWVLHKRCLQKLQLVIILLESWNKKSDHQFNPVVQKKLLNIAQFFSRVKYVNKQDIDIIKQYSYFLSTYIKVIQELIIFKGESSQSDDNIINIYKKFNQEILLIYDTAIVEQIPQEEIIQQFFEYHSQFVEQTFKFFSAEI